MPNFDLSRKIGKAVTKKDNLFAVTKIVIEIKFGDVWNKLESEKGFQRQPFTKYLRLTLVFM